MSFTIAFYVHHHGSGHLMRCLQIAGALQGYRIIFMGSGLRTLEAPSHVELVHLPMDTPEAAEQDDLSTAAPECFHYAPTGLKGIRDRTAIMSAVFSRNFPLLLVVDVSAEVTLLARLCGIPTVLIRQHGQRTDLPHLQAYQSAERLIAPFSESLYRGGKDWVYQKTFFSGGFSRFSASAGRATAAASHAAVLIGAGGTSIDAALIQKMATDAPGYFFQVFGQPGEQVSLSNVIWHGKVQDPEHLLEICEIIIGNTGHNTVMEAATLNKCFIGIPEERPFEEQQEKAAAIADRSGVRIIQPEDCAAQDWQCVLDELSLLQPDWEGVIDKGALSKIAQLLIETGTTLFKKQLPR